MGRLSIGHVGDTLLADRAVVVHVLEPAAEAGQAGEADAGEADAGEAEGESGEVGTRISSVIGLPLLWIENRCDKSRNSHSQGHAGVILNRVSQDAMITEGAVDNGGQVDEALQGHFVARCLHLRHGAIVGKLLWCRLLVFALVLMLWCCLLLWLSSGNWLLTCFSRWYGGRCLSGSLLRRHDCYVYEIWMIIHG